MVELIFPDTDWSKDFPPCFYFVYNPTKENGLIAYGYTNRQLVVWCFCEDPTNDAETPFPYEEEDWIEDDEEG